jgi:hypothetical protein
MPYRKALKYNDLDEDRQVFGIFFSDIFVLNLMAMVLD